MADIPVIILSDGEDTEEDDSLMILDSSVLIVENKVEAEIPKNIEQVDEDLAITYSQTATVLPHARYDCTHSFCRAEEDLSGPLQDNATYCDQCFCYICDKLASECNVWTIPGLCHCNAHKHSVYWKALRNKNMMGFLHELNFVFDPLDLDSDLRHAEGLLHRFAETLALKYATFLLGFESPGTVKNCKCHCHQRKQIRTQSDNLACKGCNKYHFKNLQFNYDDVGKHIQSFYDCALKENPKTCVVMLLGAIKLFMSHTAPGITHVLNSMYEKTTIHLWRFVAKVWKLLVDLDFSNTFTKGLNTFFQRLNLPSYPNMPMSLCILPWDDLLLSAVMKGQNVTGERQSRGRKLQVLHEHLIVIQARVSKLQQQNRYRELARYLKVVRCIKSSTLQKVRDLVPLYLCKVGDYTSAVETLLSPMLGDPCPASRLEGAQFRSYLRILTSGHAPEINVQNLSADPLLCSEWIPTEGSDTLKMIDVLKFALRVLDCNSTVFADSESWVYLLSLVGSSSVTPAGLPVGAVFAEPDEAYQCMARDAACDVLKELTTTSRIHIPKSFESCYPEQARLLLTIQALTLRIFQSELIPITNVILPFRLNHWALCWFYTSLLQRPDILQCVLCHILEELGSRRHGPQNIRLTEDENSVLGLFICQFFLEGNINLDPNIYPINYLIAIWDEVINPWQRCLRLHLEANVDKLNQDNCRILQLILQQKK